MPPQHGLSAGPTILLFILLSIRSANTYRLPPAGDHELPVIAVVYNAFFNPLVDWRPIVGGQLRALAESDISRHAIIYIVFSVPGRVTNMTDDDLRALLNEARHMAANVLPAVSGNDRRTGSIIHCIRENSAWEYHGMFTLWMISQTMPPNALLLYMHTKGMTHGKPHGARYAEELVMFDGTVKNWREYVTAFVTTNATRAGLWCSDTGFVWITFFWVRASYARRVEVLHYPHDRFFYEQWVGIRAMHGSNFRSDSIWEGPEQCFSMCFFHQAGAGLGTYTRSILNAYDCFKGPSIPHSRLNKSNEWKHDTTHPLGG